MTEFFDSDYQVYDKNAASFDGRPEWALHNKNNFDLSEDGAKPELSFSSI